jgi:PhnB protein
MTQINAYVNFSGNCREAMTFYKESLGGELTLQTVGGSPIESQCPAAMKDQVLHSTLVKNGTLLLMGSDMAGPEGIISGNNIALSVNCSSEKEINEFFLRLSASGKIIDPLKEQFWGAIFGVLTDKFGIRWMFNYDKNQNVQIKTAGVNASHN